MPGKAVVRYTVPMPPGSRIPGRKAEDVVLNGLGSVSLAVATSDSV